MCMHVFCARPPEVGVGRGRTPPPTGQRGRDRPVFATGVAERGCLVSAARGGRRDDLLFACLFLCLICCCHGSCFLRFLFFHNCLGQYCSAMIWRGRPWPGQSFLFWLGADHRPNLRPLVVISIRPQSSPMQPLSFLFSACFLFPFLPLCLPPCPFVAVCPHHTLHGIFFALVVQPLAQVSSNFALPALSSPFPGASMEIHNQCALGGWESGMVGIPLVARRMDGSCCR